MSQVETTKSFKVFSGVTAKEATAKTLATKATKATGTEYVAVEVEGGWSIEAVVKEVVKTPRKQKAASGATAKTNVAGRASGGAWVKQTLDYLTGKVSFADLTVTSEEGGKVWIGDSKTPKAFWFRSGERAAKVLVAASEIAAEATA